MGSLLRWYHILYGIMLTRRCPQMTSANPTEQIPCKNLDASFAYVLRSYRRSIVFFLVCICGLHFIALLSALKFFFQDAFDLSAICLSKDSFIFHEG